MSYYELLKNPLNELHRIYSQAGLELTGEVVTAVAETRKKNRQQRYGHHRYDLSSFGLRREELEERFGFYRDEYGIPCE